VSDKFQTVTAGQPLQVPAATWNAMLDAARAHEQSKFNLQAGSDSQARRPSLAKVQNQTAVVLGQFSIVGLGNPLVAPSANFAEFQRETAVGVGLPSGGDRFGVLLEPLAPGRIGMAAVAGVVATRVAVGDQIYSRAQVMPGQTSFLANVPHGPASILWMEAIGVIRWCLIRFDDSNYEEIVYITSNIPDSDGYYPGQVQRFDVGSGGWVSQFACKVVDANQ
jgi:hypothetical protein